MARSGFSKRDLTNALAAVAASGCAYAKVEIDPDGKMVVTVATQPVADQSNPQDALLKAIHDRPKTALRHRQA